MNRILSAFAFLFFLFSLHAQTNDNTLQNDINSGFGNSISANNNQQDRPAAFVANMGQLADFNGMVKSDFLYYFQSEGMDVYFKKDGVTYIFKKGRRFSAIEAATKDELYKLEKEFNNDSTYYYRLDVDFAGCNQNLMLVGEGRAEFVNNYYYPHCPDGILNVANYSAIRYRNVYDGVDILFYLKDGQIKYDIEVGNPLSFDDISFEFSGADNIRLVDNEVLISSPAGDIVETLPESYLVNKGARSENLKIDYRLSGNTVGFDMNESPENPFVIDPVITWTTYYDDSFWNGSNSRIDVKGNQVVIVSYGFSSLFPLLDAGSGAYFQNTVAGSGDYRILKFDSNAVRIWATYYGGTGYENTADVVIDYAGNIIVTGQTESTNIPVQSGTGYYDATYNAGTYGGGTFIAKFNSSGVRQWGTHYDYIQYPMVEVDHNNNIYVVAQAEYDDPPVLSLAGAYNQAAVSHDAGGTNHSDDIFIVKFNSSTTRVWATNLGSTTDEIPVDIHCGSDNYLNILAISDCYSGTGLITQNPGSGAYYDNTTGPSSTNRDDILLYRFNTANALYWGTAFGCNANDNAQQGRITTDNSNNIYIFSEAADGTLPLANPGGGAYYDGTHSGSSFNPFIAKFTSGGVLSWSTFFGTTGLGFGMNFSNYLGFNSDNNLVAVLTDNGGIPGTFPLVPRTGDYNATMAAYMGVYIAEFNSNLSIAWSTFYTGTTDRHTLGDAELSSNACGYQIYMTTRWEKYNAAAIDPIWEKPIPSSYQNTVFDNISANGSGLITRFGTKTLNATITPAGPFCTADAAQTLTAATSGGTWSGTGVTNTSSGTFDPTVAGAGTHEIIYTLAGACGDIDTVYIVVTATANATITPAGPYCLSDAAVSLSAASAGGTWSGTGVNPSTGVFTPSTAGAGTHEIIYTISGSCSDADTINITVNGLPTVGAAASPATICSGNSTTLSGSGANTYTWSSGSTTVSPANTTTYTVTGTNTTTNCTNTASVTVTVNALPSVSASVTTTPICAGSSTTISASGATTYNWSNSLGTNSSYSVSPATTTTYSVTGSDGTCTNTASVTVTVNSLPTVSATATVSPICAGSSTTISAGGATSYNWSNSLGTNSFYSVSPNSTTTYSVTGTTSGCSNSASVTVTVNPVTDAAMNAAGPFCVSDAAVTLTAVNAGGTWAGTGITNTSSGAFDPVTAGVGTHEITYTTTGPCPDTDTMYITVSSFLDASIDPAGPFCLSGTAVDLTAATSGGTWSGTGITNTSNGTFDPATAGIGTHEIIYTTTGSCGDADTIQVEVVNQLDATISAAGPFCSNDAALNLTATDPGGTWSGTGITNVSTGTFDPSVAGTGTHQIIYTISGACGDADSADIVVNDAPEFTYVATEESCTGAEDGSIAITLTSGLNPITYTWNTGASAATVTGIGEGNYLVTVTDANGCERNGTITLGDPGVACDDVNPHAVVPNAFSPNGDGENDILYVRGEGVSQLTFIVYDRWGEKVFSTTSLDYGWDGTFRGKELDPAVFTYYLHAIFVDGSDKIEKGDVTLTR